MSAMMANIDKEELPVYRLCINIGTLESFSAITQLPAGRRPSTYHLLLSPPSSPCLRSLLLLSLTSTGRKSKYMGQKEIQHVLSVFPV